MVSDIDSSAYSGGSNPPIVVNAPPPPTTAHAASGSTGTGSGRCASLFMQPPKPPTPYTRRKKRTAAPSGSARRLRVLKPGSVARGEHSLQPGTCSESSLRQCSHAHSGNRTGAFTARARRFNHWGSTHHSHKKHRARIPTQRHPTMCATKQQRSASDSLTMTDPLESVCVCERVVTPVSS